MSVESLNNEEPVAPMRAVEALLTLAWSHDTRWEAVPERIRERARCLLSQALTSSLKNNLLTPDDLVDLAAQALDAQS